MVLGVPAFERVLGVRGVVGGSRLTQDLRIQPTPEGSGLWLEIKVSALNEKEEGGGLSYPHPFPLSTLC